MPTPSIEISAGALTDQRVDLLVNSANTYLLLGTGTAEQVRDAGGYIPEGTSEFKEYWELVNEADGILKEVLDYIHSKRPIPSIVQKECLDYIIRSNKSNELKFGDAVLTTSGNLASLPNGAKHVVHAVTMAKDWKVLPDLPIISATFDSVKNSLTKSFEIADSLGCRSIAIPVMCTRKGGLSKEVSTKATIEALETLNTTDSEIRKVVIVLYSEDLNKDAEWFRQAYGRLEFI